MSTKECEWSILYWSIFCNRLIEFLVYMNGIDLNQLYARLTELFGDCCVKYEAERISHFLTYMYVFRCVKIIIASVILSVSHTLDVK